MAVVRWEPFRELTALQNEVGRYMNQFWGVPASSGETPATWLPSSDVWETEDELVIAVDLPGVPEDKVAIEVDDGVLTISGERERRTEQDGDRFYRFERRFGSFSRSVTLPQGIDASKISADFEHGVLHVHVPKPEERKPTRVQIGAQGAIEGESTKV
jgi:HSP20 family protein